MTLRSIKQLLVTLSLFACTSVIAAPLVVDVAGIASYSNVGSSQNTVLTYNVGAFATITGIAYNVNVTAFAPSYLSELALFFGNTDKTRGVYFSPGFDDPTPGTATYADSANLADFGLTFQVGADGLLRLEFFESFDDTQVAPDGIWNFGTITFFTDAVDVPPVGVPEPSTTLLVGAGLALAGYCGRSRRVAMSRNITYRI